MQKVEGSSPFIRLVSSQLRPSDRWRGPGYASDVVFFCSRNAALSDRDRFLAWVNSRLRDAEVAVHEGDAGPRREIWSRKEPVSVLGALNSATGRPQVDELFTWMESTFSGWQHRLHRGLRAHRGNRQRRVPRLFPPSNAGLPARGWRVEGCSSPRKCDTGTLAMTGGYGRPNRCSN